MAINKTIIQGRLTRDVELRHTQAGKAVASFTVAWSEKYGDTENKLFMPCVAWGQQGEFASTWFHKGQECLVEGQLRTRSWTDNNNNKRETIELIADKVHFCGPKQEGQSGQTVKPAGKPVTVAGPEPGDYAELADDDGELPF